MISGSRRESHVRTLSSVSLPPPPPTLLIFHFPIPRNERTHARGREEIARVTRYHPRSCIVPALSGRMRVAVVQQFYETRVIDEFVLRGNAATLKCLVPSFVADFVDVIEWLAVEDGLTYTAANSQEEKGTPLSSRLHGGIFSETATSTARYDLQRPTHIDRVRQKAVSITRVNSIRRPCFISLSESCRRVVSMELTNRISSPLTPRAGRPLATTPSTLAFRGCTGCAKHGDGEVDWQSGTIIHFAREKLALSKRRKEENGGRARGWQWPRSSRRSFGLGQVELTKLGVN